ncbi:MAG TPA: hypothetical protein VN229_20680 [Terriglobales bacterium]|nr:hypothetical protein [Terriglobales bacterium]
MNRLVIAAAAACLSMTALVSGAVAAGVTVKNTSGIDIDHLYASPAGKGAFGTDLMVGAPAASLDNGKTYTLNSLNTGTYDLKVTDDDDGKDCVMPNVRVKAGKPLSLTKKIGASCK